MYFSLQIPLDICCICRLFADLYTTLLIISKGRNSKEFKVAA